MEKWLNKVAVVTGAGAGIGAACCRALIENGMNVVGLDIRQDWIKESRKWWPGNKEKQQRLYGLKCDVRKEKEVVHTFETIVKDFGGIEVLINNAGIVHASELVKENNTEDLCSIVETNVLGVAYCTREAFKTMSKNDKNNAQGHVIMINSIGGHKLPPTKGISLNMYAPSKYALTAMTEAYSNEFFKHNTNIKITSISPGFVRTDMIFRNPLLNSLRNATFLEASDIADAMVYCLSTPPHVQIHELTIQPMGQIAY